jgi:hypothetical protein
MNEILNEEDFAPIKNGFENFANLKNMQLQIDHLEGTNFVQVSKKN